MDTLIFILSNNRNEVIEHLNNNNYMKIGHKHDNCVGFYIMINRKQYFEITSSKNPNFKQTTNIADLKQYCN